MDAALADRIKKSIEYEPPELRVEPKLDSWTER